MFRYRAEVAEKDEQFEDSMVCGNLKFDSEAGHVRYTLQSIHKLIV